MRLGVRSAPHTEPCFNCGAAIRWTKKHEKLAKLYGRDQVLLHLRCPVCLTVKEAETFARQQLPGAS